MDGIGMMSVHCAQTLGVSLDLISYINLRTHAPSPLPDNNHSLILLDVLLLRGPEVTPEVVLCGAPVMHKQPKTQKSTTRTDYTLAHICCQQEVDRNKTAFELYMAYCRHCVEQEINTKHYMILSILSSNVVGNSAKHIYNETLLDGLSSLLAPKPHKANQILNHETVNTPHNQFRAPIRCFS
jgi:hypothetical protein